MKTIALAASKGGTAKTTVTANLSVCAAKTQAVGALDYDLVRWWELSG